MEKPPYTIVIAGGGTAGWMTAAAPGRFLERGYRIRLVQSEAIRPVGLGDATIPHLRLYPDALGTDRATFATPTHRTIKPRHTLQNRTLPEHRPIKPYRVCP